MGADLDALVALGAFFAVPGDLPILKPKGLTWTARDTLLTMDTAVDGLRIMTVGTSQVAVLEEDGGPGSGPIYSRDGDDFVDGNLFHLDHADLAVLEVVDIIVGCAQLGGILQDDLILIKFFHFTPLNQVASNANQVCIR